ncbi:MAG TPA: anthranilate synthase component I, partial [Actinobacteria bacterium]|nr:anthranilate synthase component I [Actinomycetota bacterium]
MEMNEAGGGASGLGIRPSLEEVRSLGRQGYNFIPVYHSYISDLETPVSAFLKLGPRQDSFLLESAEQGERIGRYSFLGCDPRAIITFSDGELTIRDGDSETVAASDDPFGAIEQFLSRYRAPELEELPPFIGGAVGYFGYDLARWIEELPPPNPDDLNIPDMAFMVSDSIVIFDHLKHTIVLLANVFMEAGVDLEESYEAACERVRTLKELLSAPLSRPGQHHQRVMEEPVSNFRREEFEAVVDRVKEYIYAGDTFQTVPSQRFNLKV